MRNNTTIKLVTLYWQTADQTGANPGWAYNLIDAEGDHTSGGFEVNSGEAPDSGSESMAEVVAAFRCGEGISTDLENFTWRERAGGFEGRP